MVTTFTESTRALEGLCNAAAVLETGTPHAVLGQLIAIHLSLREDQSPVTLGELRGSLGAIGVDPLPDDLRQVVERMQDAGQLAVRGTDGLLMRPEARAAVLEACAAEQALEKAVREQWTAEIALDNPDIPGQVLWSALEEFMQSAFARHGMQTVALLDPSFDTDQGYEVSLSELQTQAINRHVPSEFRTEARHHLALFFVNASRSADRTAFIGRLADTAYAFFTLYVSPSVASMMSTKLAPLTVFLDTNFLFAFMGLHDEPFREVADRLIDAVSNHHLPVKLRYHEATAKELKSTLAHYRKQLGGKKWPQTLSRAAVKSCSVTGVELAYHLRNASEQTEVEVFFRPLEHFDALLKDRGIVIYRGSDRGQEAVSQIISDYTSELGAMGRSKPNVVVETDAKVLATVRALRGESESTLEAGALLVTCDYTLFRYDSRTARRTHSLASVLLPNMLWQILRYFVPSTREYEHAFADTFALQEFRTIQSRSASAASRMLSLLAVYGGLPEETAVLILSNEVLLRQLASVDEESEFTAAVESELVRLNQQLVEEHAAAAQEAKRTRDENAELRETARRLEADGLEERERRKAAEAEAARLAREAEEAHRDAQQTQEAADVRISRAVDQTSEERALRETTEQDRQMIARRKHYTALVAAAVVSALLIAVLVLLWQGMGWPAFLVNQERAVAMEILLMAALSAIAFAGFVSRWRKWLLGVAVFGIFLVFVQLL